MADMERWEVLESAAARMDMAASRATPGPWWRPQHLRSKNVVLGERPEDEQEAAPGLTTHLVVAMVSVLHPTGKFIRRRAGRDLEYIAMAHPNVGKGIADVLRAVAIEMKEAKGDDTNEPESWGACLRLGHRILRTGDKKRYGE